MYVSSDFCSLAHVSMLTSSHTKSTERAKNSDTRHEFRRTPYEYYTTPSGIGEGVQKKAKKEGPISNLWRI